MTRSRPRPSRRPLQPLALAVLALSAALAAPSSLEAQAEPPASPEDPARWARLAAERLSVLDVCRPEGAQEDMLCGTLSVPEDRNAPEGRRIDLKVVVVPARSAAPAPDPVVPLAGGPGDSIARAAPYVPLAFPDVLARRDVLLVDQRGTGGSNGLYCAFGITPENPQPAYDAMFPLDRVKECRRELEAKADLTKYITSIAVEDLEEVRRWLGYGQLNLVGGSYGTRFAQELMRRHPESVRTAILHGVTGMDHRMPLDHARDGQRSLDLLITLCEEDPACREAFPHLRRELWAVVDRLSETPGRATLANPLTGGEVTLSVGRGMFAEALRSLLYTPVGSAELPWIVHRAHEGDFAPFFKTTVPWRVFVELELANGLYLSVTCSEDVAWFTEEEAELHNLGTAEGDFRTAAQKSACSAWPVTGVPADFREPVATDVPVLLMVGELDPVTPPRFARAALEHMPNGRLVVIPRGHHGWEGLTHQECADGLVREFLERGTAEGLDVSCVDTMQRPPFVLEESGMRYMQQRPPE